MIKLISLGNTLMQDDGICITLTKIIRPYLNLLEISTIISETDIDFALEKIKPHDYLIIMDSLYSPAECGNIYLYDLASYKNTNHFFNSHSMNLIQALKLNNLNNQGLIIAIAVSSVDFSFSLSYELKNKLNILSTQILSIISQKNHD